MASKCFNIDMKRSRNANIVFPESKNSSQHNQMRKAHRNGSVLEKPIHDTTKALTPDQYQEAQDLQIPVAQGNRPQVPPQPPSRSPWQHEGSGTLHKFDGRDHD